MSVKREDIKPEDIIKYAKHLPAITEETTSHGVYTGEHVYIYRVTRHQDAKSGDVVSIWQLAEVVEGHSFINPRNIPELEQLG